MGMPMGIQSNKVPWNHLGMWMYDGMVICQFWPHELAHWHNKDSPILANALTQQPLGLFMPSQFLAVVSSSIDGFVCLLVCLFFNLCE